MRHLTRNGVDLSFIDVGKGGPPLVMVHCLACDHTSFLKQIEHFMGSHRVVAVDLRGHGRSGVPERGYTVTGFADDLAWLCYELGVFGPVLVGHGFGGVVCLDLCARYPDLAAGVVTLSSPVLMPDQARSFATSLFAFSGSLPDQAFQAMPRLLQRGLLRQGFHESRVGLPCVEPSTVPRDALMSACESSLAWDGEDAVSLCKVPFTYVDAGGGVTDHAGLAALCPQLTVARMPGGHFAHMKHPDRVNVIVEDLLGRVAVVAGGPSGDISPGRAPMAGTM